MVSWIIWGAGIALESLLLIRAFSGQLLRKYPFFYAYNLSVLLMAVLLLSPVLWDKLYWGSQLVTLVIGYGILLEILKHVLAPYPGAEKFARTSGLIMFGAILCFAVVFPLVMPQWSGGTSVEFERDLRMVQALFVCCLLCVVSYYRIEIGRNMKGMIFGYGLYIATSLISLATRSYQGSSFDEAWKVIQPLSLDISLIMWVVALWSYQPSPVVKPSGDIEADYEVLASKTKGVLDSIRTHFLKVARP